MRLLSKLLTKMGVVPQELPLTKREGQIYSLMRQAYSNRSIATKLGISEQTVKNYCARIYLKLHIKKGKKRLQVIQRTT